VPAGVEVDRHDSLETRLRRTFRVLLSAGVLLLVTSTTGAAMLIWKIIPTGNRYNDIVREIRLTHEAMLNQETGLRGYLATGNAKFLDPFIRGRLQLAESERRLGALVLGDASLSEGYLHLRLREQAWADDWATTAARGWNGGDLIVFLDQGKHLFDLYRGAEAPLLAAAVAKRDAALRAEQGSVTAVIVLELAVCIGSLILALRAERRLRVDVVVPVAVLTETIDRVREGDLSMPPMVHGPTELRRLGEGLADMTASLARQHALAAAETDRSERQAERLSTILGLARRIGGNLSLRYVSEAVVDAAREVASADEVCLWLVDDNGATMTAIRCSPAREVAGAEEVGEGEVGGAAGDGRVRRVEHADGRAPDLMVPMVVGARVVGVLEVNGMFADDVDAVVETLAAHAAAAIEAARLHRHAEELSETDALTRLRNRRRLERDLARELDRSNRYHRPLGLLMIDLDHFKRLNDTFGHQFGDEVLQQVASLLESAVRAPDAVYRYGGEELVVVASESDGEATSALAERLRLTIERAFADRPELARVTMSVGVALAPDDGTTSEELVGVADRRLYEAKAAGRNLVRDGRSVTPAL
jgi:diguanylate cyclase (GGDEF)-like protein